jgi:LPS sulfotransferase NodH
MFELIKDPGVHEFEIRRYFEDRVRYDKNVPVFDLPLVVLLFTNRCGSNLFADYAVNLGLIGGLEEVLNYDEVIQRSEKFGINSFPEYIEKSALVHTSKNAVYGVKAGVEQLCMLARWGITRMFREVIVLHVERSDLLDQAISMSIATQTQQWTSEKKSLNDNVEFRFDEINRIIELNSDLNAAGRIFSQAMSYNYERFTYENFSLDASVAMNRVSNALSLGVLNSELPSPRIRKQANELNLQFRAKYLSLLKEISGATQPQNKLS